MTIQKLAPPKIPECGFIRLKQVLEIIPVSKSSWYDGVRRGLYPRGVQISDRVTAWSRSDIQALIDRISAGNQPMPKKGALISDAANDRTGGYV